MSADVDAAREALLMRYDDEPLRPKIDAFEAAIRAEGLDVDRLAEAIKATYTGGAYLNWLYYRQAAKSIAAEYARLAKDAER